MSTFIICISTYILRKSTIRPWVQRFSECRMGGIAMKRSLDVAAIVLTALLLLAFAALSLRGLDRAGTGVGALRRAGCRCRRQPVLSGLPVTQSRHRHYRRDIPAHATMDTARHSSNRDGGLAGVRHDGAVFERGNPAGLSSACAGADRNHRRPGVATGGRGQGLVYTRSEAASRKTAVRLSLKTAVKSRSSRFWRQPTARLARFWALVFRSNRRKARGFPS